MNIVSENGVYYCEDNEVSFAVTCDFPIEVWNSPYVFEEAGIKGYEPMTAKELETAEMKEEAFNSLDNFIEEKFDGTRALLYFLEDDVAGFCRVFSRRVSKKTGFYAENTDSLPQLKFINKPSLSGTVLDGEMFINDRPFKDVSSTLNCLWDKAIERQLELGFITLHAFDILFYKGVDLRRMPLERRKVYLHLAIEEADSPYIEEVEFFNCGSFIQSSSLFYLDRIESGDEELFLEMLENNKDIYPSLYDCVTGCKDLTPKAYYELIVSTGGEGVIIKSKKGRYYHKRGREYSKIKKFLTRELIITGFTEPTKEYTGKDIKKWSYWERKSDHKKFFGNFYGDAKYEPITKHYFNEQIGTIRMGVLITPKEYESLKEEKRGTLVEVDNAFNPSMYLMEVCECSGIDDDMRRYLTDHAEDMIGCVAEVKANEIMRDSGRLRHPRFLRIRTDKNADLCTWKDHII